MCYIWTISTAVDQILSRETKQAMLDRSKYLFLIEKGIFRCSFVKIIHDFTSKDSSSTLHNF